MSNGVAYINETDTQLITTNEAREFAERLAETLEFGEVAEMRLARLTGAQSAGELGGWPEGFVVPVEAVAAYALLAQDLEHEAERMQKWAQRIRMESTYLFHVRGPNGDDG